MNPVFVDTSAWIALFVSNDENHKYALSIFNKLKTDKTSLYTSDYVIDETVTTILNRGNHKQAVTAGTSLLESSIIEIIYIAPDFFDKAWKKFKKYKDKKFSFTDVSSFVVMKDLNIHQAFTFDKDFSQAGFNILQP